jgi:hydroxyacylglutathione hydrolase
MQVYKVNVKGYFSENCYFLIDEKTKHGFLIDPGAEGKKLLQIMEKHGWTIEKILLTHGHFDHTGGIQAIEAAKKIPVWCHENRPQYLLDTDLNLSAACGLNVTVREYHTFKDGDRIALEANPSCFVTVMYTPGHTRDSVVFYDEADSLALVGDTIFRGNTGNPNYPTGNAQDLMIGILTKILQLPEDTMLLSGHSEPTMVGLEKPAYMEMLKG